MQISDFLSRNIEDRSLARGDSLAGGQTYLYTNYRSWIDWCSEPTRDSVLRTETPRPACTGEPVIVRFPSLAAATCYHAKIDGACLLLGRLNLNARYGTLSPLHKLQE
jgi:hypothetical protein